jgi:catecholate siderophore receptor
MSASIRGTKRPPLRLHDNANGKAQGNSKSSRSSTIQDNIRSPLSSAAVGLASMMLAGSAAAQDSSAPLPAIDVSGGGGGYQTPVNSGLTRVPTPLLSTPQTVNVVPQQVIQDQNVSDVRDALKNVAGVTFRAGEGGNQGDTPYIRGFSAQNDIFRDGVRDPGWYTRDAFPIEAVEVYKGPAAVLFGRGSTGGAINLISKLPQDRTFVEGTVSGNTGPGVRATVDANGRLNDNTTARIVVMGQRYDIPDRDHVETNRWGFAPSIKTVLGDRSTNTFSYIYQHDNNIPDYGVPFLNIAFGNPRPIAPVPRNTWYGILGGTPDVEKLDAHILTNKFEHEFNNDVKVVNSTRYSSIDHFQRNIFPEPPPISLTALWTPNRNQVGVTNTMAANTTDFIAKFNTGTWEHTTVSGVEFSRETRDFQRNTFTGQAGTNLFDPDPYRFGGTVVPTVPTGLTSAVATDIAVYVADQVKLNQYFELLGSVRVERFRFEQNAPLEMGVNPSLVDIGRTDDLFSWRVGAVFHPTQNSSIYVMRGTSFNPSADNMSISLNTVAAATSLTQLKPEQNETSEVGVKADVLDGKLTLQSAVFHTIKTNLRIPDPSNFGVNVLGGHVTADGFEASAAGKITDAWQVIASYAYVHARITQTSVPLALNREPTNTPTNSFSLWTTYDLTKKFQVGFGAFFTDEVFGDLPTTSTAATVPQSALVPAWWRFDAMAAYKISDKATLQLNVYNLTDEFYYQSAYSNWAVPGPGRSAALTLRVKW